VSATHEELIRSHFEAWNTRDRAGMVRDLAEDVVIVEDTGLQISAGEFHGHEGAFALWEQLFEVADNARLDVLEVERLDDERSLVLLMMHATMRLSGISASREMAHIWRFRDGKVVRVKVFGAHEDARAAI